MKPLSCYHHCTCRDSYWIVFTCMCVCVCVCACVYVSACVSACVCVAGGGGAPTCSFPKVPPRPPLCMSRCALDRFYMGVFKSSSMGSALGLAGFIRAETRYHWDRALVAETGQKI